MGKGLNGLLCFALGGSQQNRNVMVNMDRLALLVVDVGNNVLRGPGIDFKRLWQGRHGPSGLNTRSATRRGTELKYKRQHKVCPFCGGKDIEVVQGMKVNICICGGCGAKGPISDDGINAIKNWNFRKKRPAMRLNEARCNLEPCPFCGRAPDAFWGPADRGECTPGGFVICCICGMAQVCRTDKLDAVEAWNSRFDLKNWNKETGRGTLRGIEAGQVPERKEEKGDILEDKPGDKQGEENNNV